MRLTKDRENQIKEIVKHFPNIQAEKRVDTRKLPELVDMKPYIKELLAEVEALRESSNDWQKVVKLVSDKRDKLQDKVKELEEKCASSVTNG